jgi:hypothetical protein
MALTNARSKGGKLGLSTATREVSNGEIAGTPASPPALNLAGRQSHGRTGHFIAQGGLVMKQKGQPKPLHSLHGRRSLPNNSASLL